jgi:Mlc titration factor MtfA (ptsG expression regulator)
MNVTTILSITVFLLVAMYLIFRKKKIVPVALSKADKKLLLAHVEFYQQLDSAKKLLFEQKIGAFLGGVRIEGVGLTVTPLDRILVAASAVIPIFGFEEWTYKNLGSVVLYPNTFNKDFQFEEGDRNIMGMVGNGYLNGQMILSQPSLYHGFSKSAGKGNTGIHEFVHLIDDADGFIDGIPENLLAKQYTIPWIKMMHEEMDRIEKNRSDINPYALTNQAEFFAVASEYFFEQPDSLKSKHPDLYLQLSRVFEQNLATESAN